MMKKICKDYEPAFDNKRLRVFDLMTPWFYIVCFYQPKIYGDAWFRLEIFDGRFTPTWWWNFWIWEFQPSNVGYEALWKTLSPEENAEKSEPIK